jgi:hypothetical protein
MSEHTFGATIGAAEQIDAIIRARGFDVVVIGAMALAVHRYPRETEDLDLAVAVPPAALGELAADLRSRGWRVDLREPDSNDPLGGVIDVQVPGADLVQVVNFDNSPAGGFPRLVREACLSALPLAPESSLKVADLFALIAFKLYAGGPKSQLDILELLERNQPVDMAGLRNKCQGLGLSRQLERVLELARR